MGTVLIESTAESRTAYQNQENEKPMQKSPSWKKKKTKPSAMCKRH